MDRISPTGDLAFKKVFASEENKDVLGGLIRDYFEITAEEITIENPYSIDAYREFVNNKEVAVLRHTLTDVSASFKTADFISELQVKKTRFFDERVLYYPFERFCKNYSKEGRMVIGSDGKPFRYSSLRPVYALNILGYTHFQNDDEALRIFEMYDPKRNKGFGKELLRIGFFELTKTNVETANQQHWHDYFTTGVVMPDAPEYIKKASRTIEFVNLGEEERTVALAIERAQAIHDAEIVSSFLDGKDEGRAEGRTEGRTEGIYAVVRNLLKRNRPIDEIMEDTGLTREEVEKLK